MAHPPALSPENAVSGENVPAAARPSQPSVLGTMRLSLRPWRDTDAPGPGEGPDAESLRFMPSGAQPGRDDFPAWLAQRRRDLDTVGDLHWCVADGSADAMLGNVQIFRMGPVQDRFQGELGYWLRPGARGHGIIGEALKPVIAHAFTPIEHGGLGLVRLHAATDSDNHASQSILQSAGFTQWGADHQAWRRTDGSLSDGVYFELLVREMWASGRCGGNDHTRSALDPVTLDNNPPQAGDTPGVRLRAWRHTDAERVMQACSDERTRHWLAHSLPSPYTL